ncbi:hypothetical protein D3C79_1020550 [compost metagenome]
MNLQGSYAKLRTELSTGCAPLSAFGQQQQIARGERLFTKHPELYLVGLFLQEQCAIEHQPKFQRAAEHIA